MMAFDKKVIYINKSHNCIHGSSCDTSTCKPVYETVLLYFIHNLIYTLLISDLYFSVVSSKEGVTLTTSKHTRDSWKNRTMTTNITTNKCKTHHHHDTIHFSSIFFFIFANKMYQIIWYISIIYEVLDFVFL